MALFKRPPLGKQFFKDNPVSPELQRIFNYRAGTFKVTNDKLVLVKAGGRIISLGILQEPMEKIVPQKIRYKG